MNDNKIKKSNFASARAQQIQIVDEVDSIRIMNNCFNNNIKKFIKHNKYCLGDIQDAYKVKASKQEQLLSEQAKQQIFQHFLEKMKKDMLSRNNSVIKNFNQYQRQYHQHFETAKQTFSQSSCNQPVQKQPQVQQIYEKSIQKDMRKTTRPMSSTISRFISKGNNSYHNRFNRTILCNNSNQFQSFQCVSVCHTSKTQSSNKKTNTLISTYRQRVKSYVIQNSEVFIQEGNPNNCNNISGCRRLSKQNIYKFGLASRCPKKQQIKSMINNGNLEQIELSQIKNKILMVNSVLAVNLAKSQGYKPKSQCWNKQHF